MVPYLTRCNMKIKGLYLDQNNMFNLNIYTGNISSDRKIISQREIRTKCREKYYFHGNLKSKVQSLKKKAKTVD